MAQQADLVPFITSTLVISDESSLGTYIAINSTHPVNVETSSELTAQTITNIAVIILLSIVIIFCIILTVQIKFKSNNTKQSSSNPENTQKNQNAKNNRTDPDHSTAEITHSREQQQTVSPSAAEQNYHDKAPKNTQMRRAITESSLNLNLSSLPAPNRIVLENRNLTLNSLKIQRMDSYNPSSPSLTISSSTTSPNTNTMQPSYISQAGAPAAIPAMPSTSSCIIPANEPHPVVMNKGDHSNKMTQIQEMNDDEIDSDDMAHNQIVDVEQNEFADVPRTDMEVKEDNDKQIRIVVEKDGDEDLNAFSMPRYSHSMTQSFGSMPRLPLPFEQLSTASIDGRIKHEFKKLERKINRLRLPSLYSSRSWSKRRMSKSIHEEQMKYLSADDADE